MSSELDNSVDEQAARGRPFSMGSVSRFRQPHSVEQSLAPYQVASARAYARVLNEKSLISDEVLTKVLSFLAELEEMLSRGESFLTPEDMDIYSGLERKLDENLGPASNILRMGLSPNDHFACDIRLWMKDETLASMQLLLDLRTVVLALAEAHRDVVMPGYSHMQPASPELLAHWWLASASRFARDFRRLADCFARIDLCPLGAGAFAGSHQPIDRVKLAEHLGFAGVLENSLDAVTDRDSVVELSTCANLVAVHISQMATELLLWATQEFGYVRLPRAFSYRTRNFPQKRNPEPLEVLRSRSAQMTGRLGQFLCELQGIPISYSHDLQESLPGLLEVMENLRFILELTSVVLPAMIFDTTRMEERAGVHLANAGNVMDYVIERNFEPDKASKIVEGLMKYCRQRSKHFIDLTRGEWQEFSPAFDDEIYRYITASTATEIMDSLGGTAHLQVDEALRRGREELGQDRDWLSERSGKKPKS